MKRQLQYSFSLKLFIVLMLCFQPGCKKTDRQEEISAFGKESVTNAQQLHGQSEENADVVYEWYKFMSVLQRNVTPQPLPFTAGRAYAYIGIGLFESVQPGIRGGSSFSPKLNQMPAMPKPDHSKDYLWKASANAALAGMFKQFLTNLSVEDKASIDAKELAIYNNLKLTTSEDVLQRSVAFGRSVAAAIYLWSGSDNYNVTSGSYTPLNEPWAWILTPPNLPQLLEIIYNFQDRF